MNGNTLSSKCISYKSCCLDSELLKNLEINKVALNFHLANNETIYLWGKRSKRKMGDSYIAKHFVLVCFVYLGVAVTR